MIKSKERIIGEKKVNAKGEICYTAEHYSNGGSEGYIYKNFDAFLNPERYPEDEIVYIPEYGFPKKLGMTEIPKTEVKGYTRQSLIELSGSSMVADSLFDILSWQFPETLWNELCDDSDKNGHWIEAQMVYEKVYKPQFKMDHYRKKQAPVCYDEFFHNDWQDEKIRRSYLERLVELKFIDEGIVQEAMSDFNTMEDIEEEVEYSTLVAENIQKEYEQFCANELRQSKEEIFADSYRIQFYKEIHGYLTNSLNPLDYEHYKALNLEGEKVIALLWKENLKSGVMNIGDWDRITNFIDNYARCFHKEIFKEEAEVE